LPGTSYPRTVHAMYSTAPAITLRMGAPGNFVSPVFVFGPTDSDHTRIAESPLADYVSTIGRAKRPVAMAENCGDGARGSTARTPVPNVTGAGCGGACGGVVRLACANTSDAMTHANADAPAVRYRVLIAMEFPPRPNWYQ